MMKTFTKAIALLLAVLLCIGAAAGCGSSGGTEQTQNTSGGTAAQGGSESQSTQEEELPIIKMTASFGDGWADGQDGPFNDEIAKEITRITRVEIENIPTGETIEAQENKLNILLVSGDYPELLRVTPALKKYIQEGALLPMDELIEEYGKNIKGMYGDTLKKYRNMGGGKIYHLGAFHGYKEEEGFFCMNIRYDLLKQLDPAVADSHKPITPEKFYELLKAFKEKFPKLDGKVSIPLSFSQDQRHFDSSTLGIIGIIKAAYGIKEFSEDSEHNLKIDLKDPRYLEVLKYLALLNREKLLDPEWPILKYQEYIAKLSEGSVFATSGAWFEVLLGPNPELLKKDPSGNSQFFAYVIAADGVTNPPLYNNSDIGAGAIAITKNCKDPVRAIKFLDFLASPDGNFLTFWGPQGKLWDIVDGKRVVKKEFADEYNADSNAFWNKYQTRRWNITNGQDLALEKMTFPDGTTFQPLPAVENPQTVFFDWQKKTLFDENNTMYDGYLYNGDDLYPDTGSEEAIIQQKFIDMKEKELFRLILESKNDEEVAAGLQKLIEKADALGIEKFEKYVTEKFKAKLAALQ